MWMSVNNYIFKKREIVYINNKFNFTGTDDAWALLLLLKTEKLANLKIKAITCVHGNTNVKNVSANVIRILSIANRTDVSFILYIIV